MEVLLYCDQFLNGGFSSPDWLNPSNAQGDTPESYSSSAVGSEPPDVFSNLSLQSVSDASFSTNYVSPRPSPPTTKQFVVLDNWVTPPTISIAKAKGLQLRVRMETDGSDDTDAGLARFLAASFTDLDAAAAFVAAEIEYHNTTEQRIYRVRLRWSVPGGAVSRLSRSAARSAAVGASRGPTAFS